jgi:hypothetical protein
MRLHVNTPDKDEKIQWSRNFQLKLEHFQDEITSKKGGFAISILPEYDIGFIGNQLEKYRILNIRIKSLFRPNDAHIDREVWPIEKNEMAMLFYQGAFDLSEDIARKAQTDLEQKLFRKLFVCRGRGKSEKRRFAQEDAKKCITKLMMPLIKEYFEEQIKYEKVVGNPEEFEKHFSEYKTRFDRIRKEVLA